MICAYIMAGGFGERFWPLSTSERPKQLLKLLSDKSMIRETVDRILPLIPKEQIFIGTNIKQSEAIMDEIPMIPKENIVIEPAFKDTAAAIGYGALYIKHRIKDACMIVLASDHLIQDEESFRWGLQTAVSEAIFNNSIVTLGIKPSYPETGYGYIQIDEKFTINNVYSVKKFWEKPNKERAEEYVLEGNYLWNSGMFIFKVDTILEEMKRYMPKHHNILEVINVEIQRNYSGNELAVKTEQYFEKFERISIDFGVMEHSNRIKVIPSDFGWNDIGNFASLKDYLYKDDNGNAIKNTYFKQIDSKDNIIITDGYNVRTIGINNCIIVQTEDKLLICDIKRAQDIKKLLK